MSLRDHKIDEYTSFLSASIIKKRNDSFGGKKERKKEKERIFRLLSLISRII